MPMSLGDSTKSLKTVNNRTAGRKIKGTQDANRFSAEGLIAAVKGVFAAGKVWDLGPTGGQLCAATPQRPTGGRLTRLPANAAIPASVLRLIHVLAPCASQVNRPLGQKPTRPARRVGLIPLVARRALGAHDAQSLNEHWIEQILGRWN
jgi:hypothetical protein